jgi:hypothetical protein
MSKKKTTPPDQRTAGSAERPKPDATEPKPRVHKELEGFNIQINSFGEISNSYDIDKINQFLNKTVDDKKLRHRADLRQLKGETGPDPTAETAPATEGDLLLPPADDLPDEDLPPAAEKE